MKPSKIILTLALTGLFASTSIAADAAANWSEYCSRCHAKDGSGNTKPGRKLKLKDYRDAAVQAEMTVSPATEAKRKCRATPKK